jgi:predicted lipoprotein with Yx(FWY)xxD motif
MTRTRVKTVLISLSLVLMAALTVAACGAGGSATATSSTASASGGRSATISVGNSVLGQILVDAQGHTLYLFKADSRSASACGGACAAAWPPLLARGNSIVGGGADPSLASTIQRPSGARQLTYGGHPLYLFAGDQKRGDVNGQGVTAFGALWYAMSPSGNQVSTSPSGSGVGAASPGGLGY